MGNEINEFSQNEYSRVLDLYNASKKELSQTECEDILIQEGAGYHQAKDGAYFYLHHREHQIATISMTQDKYDKMLDRFGAKDRQQMECIKYLENKDFSYGQSKSAVYKYFKNRNLLKKSTYQYKKMNGHL